MNGDYTKVPLRADERWTGARMQQGRVLLDHEWNLNIDAPARALEMAAYDAIGAAGVRAGTNGFKVEVTVPPSGTPDLSIDAGHMWVGGALALAPAPFTYSSQKAIAPLPQTGKFVVYLDAFEEHVQPSESPAELVDPALAPVQSAARTRIGYRVRLAPAATGVLPRDAWAAVRSSLVVDSGAALTIAKSPPTASGDPCAPAGDPAAEVPEGLFRVEVLDGGPKATARFAWAFDNGTTVAQVLTPPTSGAEVLIESSPSARFAKDDLVELSWLERRADRAPHGALYTVTNVTAKPQGIALALTRSGGFTAPPAGAQGLVVRRWDGQAQGAGPHTAKYRQRDVAVVTAVAAVPPVTGPAKDIYQSGDWWGARLRNGSAGLEARSSVAPDGTPHAFAPLAYVDIGARTAKDLRPSFRPLIAIKEGTCTVTLDPDSDLQSEIDKLPSGGAQVCFKPGTYVLPQPLHFSQMKRLMLRGAGPSTVLASSSSEAAILFEDCTDVHVRDLRVEGGPATTQKHDGALTFLSCIDVSVKDCILACADAAAPGHTCLTLRPKVDANQYQLGPDLVSIERNVFEVGAQQIGVLIVSSGRSRVAGNRLALGPGIGRGSIPPFARQGIVVGGTRAAVVQIDDNQIADAVQGIHVGLSDTGTVIKAGRVQVRGNAIDVLAPLDYGNERHAILVATADSIQVLENNARLTRFGGGTPTPVTGVVIKAPQGPMMVVRDTALDGFEVGVAVIDIGAKGPNQKVWYVEGTMAANGKLALDAPEAVEQEHNAPMPAGGKLKKLTFKPASVGPGTLAQGEVELDAIANRLGAQIALASSSSAVTVPATVNVAPGALTATFTATAAPNASLTTDTPVTITATHKLESPPEIKQTATLTVVGKVAVQALGLNPPEIIGASGAKVQATVSITKADPNAVVSLVSDKPSIAQVPATVPVATGTSSVFNVTASPVNADQDVTITASLNGASRVAALRVKQEPLLKISRIRVINVTTDTGAPTHVWFDTSAPGNAFFPSRVMALDSHFEDLVALPNAIEVEFVGGPVDQQKVVAGANFKVSHPTNTTLLAALPQPPNPRVRTINISTVRWVADSLPTLAPGGLVSRSTPYDIEILGDGGQPVVSQRGRRLDGELTQLPSGNGTEGGNADFDLKIKRFREIHETGAMNDHIERAHPDTYIP